MSLKTTIGALSATTVSGGTTVYGAPTVSHAPIVSHATTVSGGGPGESGCWHHLLIFGRYGVWLSLLLLSTV